MTAPAPISVERLRELLAKATPGPWYTGHLCRPDHNCTCPFVYAEGQAGMGAIATVGTTDEDVSSQEEAGANQELIVAAVNALPALLQQLAERGAEVERLNAECNDRIRQALENGQAFHAAERAWEEACGLLREVASDYGARHFLGDDLDDRIAAFLAASGGA